jgi:DNA-binding protein
MMKKLSHGYITSKDYENLFELAQKQRIVCFVNVKDYKDEGGYILQDICQTQVHKTEERMEICARGIAYISAFDFREMTVKQDFIQQCEIQNLEYIEPDK